MKKIEKKFMTRLTILACIFSIVTLAFGTSMLSALPRDFSADERYYTPTKKYTAEPTSQKSQDETQTGVSSRTGVSLAAETPGDTGTTRTVTQTTRISSDTDGVTGRTVLTTEKSTTIQMENGNTDNYDKTKYDKVILSNLPKKTFVRELSTGKLYEIWWKDQKVMRQEVDENGKRKKGTAPTEAPPDWPKPPMPKK